MRLNQPGRINLQAAAGSGKDHCHGDTQHAACKYLGQRVADLLVEGRLRLRARLSLHRAEYSGQLVQPLRMAAGLQSYITISEKMAARANIPVSTPPVMPMAVVSAQTVAA